MLTLALLSLLQLQTPDSPRAVVREAVSAVQGDSVAAVARRWEAAARTPESARSARFGLALLAELTYHRARADSLLESLLPSSSQPADEVAVRARLEMARLARSAGEYPKAERLLIQAREEAQRSGDRRTGVEALLLLAITRARTAGPSAAEALFSQAAPLLGDDPFLGALYHCGRAEVAVLDSRPATAEADLGAELAVRAGDDRLRSSCLAARAEDRARRGDIDGAVADMGRAAALSRRLRDSAALATALQWRGFWLRSVGELERARHDLERAIVAARVADAGPPRAWAYANLAFIDLAVGDARSGAAHSDSAEALFAAQGDRYGSATLAGVQGDLAFMTGDLEDAGAAYQREVEIAGPLRFSVALITARIGLAHVDIARREWSGAERELDDARAAAVAADMPGRVEGLLYHRGVLDLKRGRLDAAETELSTGLQQVEAELRTDTEGGQPDRAYYYTMRLAEIRALRHDPDGAAKLAAQAMDDLEAWRATLSTPQLRVQAFQVSEDLSDPDLGFAAIVAELVRQGRTRVALGLAERLRARSLQDQRIRLGAVHGRAPSGSAIAHVSADRGGVTAGEIMSAIPDATAILDWVTGRGGEPTTLFVLTRSDLQARVLSPADSIEPEIRRLNALIGSGEWPRSLARSVARDVLGDTPALLGPAVRHLVVVPDGPLHLVPFNALLLEDGSLLEKRFAVSEETSASTAARVWRSSPEKAPPAVLAFGDPLLPSRLAHRLPSLPGAAAEARWVARYGTGSAALVGSAASEARLKAVRPGRFGIVHFATHSRVDESTLAGVGLLLSPGDGEDGMVRAREVARLHLDAKLVILSGCATASGRIVRGEGVVGLASAFRAAGVQAVVLTRWPLEDREDRGLVRALYRGLASGLPISEAVQAATLEARARGAPPAVWATLTVVGDERVTVPLRSPGRGAPLIVGSALLFAGLLGGIYLVRRTRPSPLSAG